MSVNVRNLSLALVWAVFVFVMWWQCSGEHMRIDAITPHYGLIIYDRKHMESNVWTNNVDVNAKCNLPTSVTYLEHSEGLIMRNYISLLYWEKKKTHQS